MTRPTWTVGQLNDGDEVVRVLDHLLITGPVGAGKSAVAAGIAAELRDQGARVVTVSAAQALTRAELSLAVGRALMLAEQRRRIQFGADQIDLSAHVLVLDGCLGWLTRMDDPFVDEGRQSLARLLLIGGQSNVWVVATEQQAAAPNTSISDLYASFDILAVQRDFDGHSICTEMRVPGLSNTPVLVQMVQAKDVPA